MIMISEQVKELKKCSGICLQYCNEQRAKELLREAADTIESLSAKLQVANMENGGGWISCEDRLPENISTVIVQVKEIEKPTFGWYGNMENKWILSEKDFVNLEEFSVMAWQPLPEPYRP